MTALLLALVTSGAALEMGSVVSVPPHVGVVLGASDTPGVALFLPWVLKITSEDEGVFRPQQLVIEPGVVFRAETSFTARVAVRWLRAPLTWLSLGGGMGMGLEAGKAVRGVSSLELVARLGPGPTGFGMLTARVELRMDGTAVWMLAAGATYW
ncbi:MAG: hypothetical protein Q8L48_16965 [Archangium sp.]|nr:hypothetical protein [Archangium sp.]